MFEQIQPFAVMSSSVQNDSPVLTFEGKRYDLNTLPDELKELVRGMQVADAQLRMHEDTLKVLAVGRQSLAMQLNEKLKDVTPLPEGEG